MGKLFLVRHGQTEYNNTLRFQGVTDIPLNSTGVEQAAKVGEYFKNIELSVIYSSPLSRAFVTAEAIGKDKKLVPNKVDAFKEVNFGVWEGMHSSDIAEQYSEEWSAFFDHPATALPPEGETMQQAQKRAYEAVLEIIARHPEEDIAIVAHGGIIRLLFCAFLGIDLDRLWNVQIANCSTTCFAFWQDNFTLKFANLNYYLDM